METEITYLKDGLINSMNIRGTEGEEEIASIINRGYIPTLERYGLQYNVDEPIHIIPSSIIHRLAEVPETRDILISYLTTIFDISDREAHIAIRGDDMSFINNIKSLPTRGTNTISTYPILRGISLVPHVPIHVASIYQSIYDKRHIPSLFRSIGSRGDVCVLYDTLSIDGPNTIAGLRDRVTKGGIVIIIDTDYRHEKKEIYYMKVMVDHTIDMIDMMTRYYKPRYQYHSLLEGAGLIHMYTDYIDKVYDTYISIYMFRDDISIDVDRTYSIPPIMKDVRDIFPPIDGVMPSVSIGTNYNIDDLYSIDNPIHSDAHSIYKMIREKSRSTPSIYIDHGGIGTMIASFSKYNKVYIQTDRVQEALTNILLYRRGKVSKIGTHNPTYTISSGNREIVVGTSVDPIPGSVVITTDSSREYKDILYKIVRVPLGSKSNVGKRHDLMIETVYIVDPGIRTYPEREMLRLYLIERMYNTFSQLVPKGDFRRYLFDVITIGERRGILLDSLIPMTSSILIPDSLIEMVVSVPSEWTSFVKLVRTDYPEYWSIHSKDILSILPFQVDKRRVMMSKFKDYVTTASVSCIAESLHSTITDLYNMYREKTGTNIRVHIEVVGDKLKVSSSGSLIDIMGKRTITFTVTPSLLEGRRYEDVAAMLLRHHILDGDGIPSSIDAIELFGSPLSHMPTWRSIYDDIDPIWGSSGRWDNIGDAKTIYVNPPYWNEGISSFISDLVDMKVYVPRIYADRVRGLPVIIV